MNDEMAREYERAFAVPGGDFRGLLADGTAKVRTSTWRKRAGWSIAAMLMLCCGIGGLWYEEVLRDRRVAAVEAETARKVAYRDKLAENFESDCECEIDCLEGADEAEPEPEVEIAVESAPIAPAACPWNAKHQLLRLGVQAKSVDEAKLPPCNLTFLVDVSGSMMGEDRIELVKKALKMLVGKLREEDHVAVVTYANDTAVRLPSVSGREKRAIGEVIDGLIANGGTAGGDGIQRAYAEAQKNFDKKANNRVILVTDGDFNIGISSPKELEEFIRLAETAEVYAPARR